jgi:hypothetical protein
MFGSADEREGNEGRRRAGGEGRGFRRQSDRVDTGR